MELTCIITTLNIIEIGKLFLSTVVTTQPFVMRTELALSYTVHTLS